MGRRAVVLLAWVLSTVLAAGVAWAAVGAVGRGPTSGDDVLSQADAEAALEARRATASASPTATPPDGTAGPDSPDGPTATPDPTPTDTPTPTTEPTTPPDAVVRTWPVEGGTVSASCTGAAISLLYATASDGWAYEVKDQGPEHVEVELESGDAETHVRAACVGGVPEMSLEADAGGDDDGGGSDD